MASGNLVTIHHLIFQVKRGGIWWFSGRHRGWRRIFRKCCLTCCMYVKWAGFWRGKISSELEIFLTFLGKLAGDSVGGDDEFRRELYRIRSELSRSNAFSSDRNSSSLFSCGTTSGFLSSILEWLPIFRLNGSALPLSLSTSPVLASVVRWSRFCWNSAQKGQRFSLQLRFLYWMWFS